MSGGRKSVKILIWEKGRKRSPDVRFWSGARFPDSDGIKIKAAVLPYETVCEAA